MTTLAAPADGALGATAVAFLDADIPWWLTVPLLFLAFAIGHGTGRVQRRIDPPPIHRHADYARFDTRMPPQLLSDARTPVLSDKEFIEWSRRLDAALRAQSASRTSATMPEKRVVCGRPAETNLGAVRCLGVPGHAGRC